MMPIVSSGSPGGVVSQLEPPRQIEVCAAVVGRVSDGMSGRTAALDRYHRDAGHAGGQGTKVRRVTRQ
jgi:hypothetical protein